MNNSIIRTSLAILLFAGCQSKPQPNAVEVKEVKETQSENATLAESLNPKIKALEEWKKQAASEITSTKVWPSTYDGLSDAGFTRYNFDKSGQLVSIETGSIFMKGNSYWIKNNALAIADISQIDEVEEIHDFVYFESGKPFARLQNGKEIAMGDISVNENFSKELNNAQYARKPAPELTTPTPFNFAGIYTYANTTLRDDMPEAQLNLKLEFEETGSSTLLGGFNGFVQFGAKMEEGEDAYACKIHGTAYSDIAVLNCTSCYSGETFFAYLLHDNGKFTWWIYDGEAHVPNKMVLKKQ